MDLRRRTGETDLEYHKRLVYGKLVDKTLADADYSEIAEIIYGRRYASDVARRMLYGSRHTFETMDKDSSINIERDCDVSLLHELESKRIELQKERQRFLDQRREYNKIVTYDARWERLCDTLKKSADDMMPIGDILGAEMSISGNSTSNNEAVVVISDVHYGMIADNVFNKYNTYICRQRLANIVRKAAERIVLHNCSNIHIVILGDVLHGSCHVGTRVMSEELTSDQLMNVSELLAQSIFSLSKFAPETYVHMTYGNHARTIQNKNDSIHRDNMERVVPWYLKQRLSEYKNITVEDGSEDEFLLFDVCGYSFCASHGDLDGVKTSPRLLTTLFHKRRNKDIDYILLGDKHHAESFEELGVCAMMCGSLCGTDDYANEHRLYSEPSQLMLIVSPSCGVDAEYRLKC